MMGYMIKWLFAGIFSLTLISSVNSSTGDNTQFIETLLELISQSQTKTEQPLIPLKQWHRMKGSYYNELKFNFHGSVGEALARELIGIYDNNIFVTAYLLVNLLDAIKYGHIPKPSEDDISLGIQFLDNFRKKGTNFSTSAMTFWPLFYDHKVNIWRSNIDNYKAFVKIWNEFSESHIENFLKLIGFNSLADEVKNFTVYIEFLDVVFDLLIQQDLDDSSMNFAVGTLLYELRDQYNTGWTMWNDQNSNLTSVFDAVKRTAYRPFSDDPNVNTIDPQVYFYIRKFLDKAKVAGEDIALAVTWLRSPDEIRHPFIMDKRLAFNFNDIEVCSQADFVYGITSSILNGMLSADLLLSDPLLEQIYLNSTSLVAFALQTNFSGRPDAAMYFNTIPSCYFFVSRLFFILETAHQQGAIPIPVMEKVYNVLKDVFMKDITENILSQAKVEDDKFYFDDFLGNDDLTKDNMPLNRGEDRLFTTAVSANSLMSIWSIYDETTGKSHWRPETSESVKETVAGSVKWLIEHTLDGNYIPDSIVFTIPFKHNWALPIWFPANRFEYLNGTAIDDWTTLPNKTFLYAVSGYIEPDDYEAMLEEPHFGVKTRLSFDGYNHNEFNLLYCSSVPYSYSTILLAVSRFDNIVE